MRNRKAIFKYRDGRPDFQYESSGNPFEFSTETLDPTISSITLYLNNIEVGSVYFNASDE